jgi:phosphate butyryltransferase
MKERTILPKEAIRSLAEMREQARARGPKRVAVVMAEDDVALTAAADALKLGLALPVLIGDEKAIRARAAANNLDELISRAEIIATDRPGPTAARMAGEGSVDILMKGHLRTDELLRAVLDKAAGLRTGRLLSDILFYEDVLSGERRLVGITDGGLNVAPDLEQKKQIVLNAIEVMRCLGFDRPKIAIMSASEAVSDAMPSTVDAKLLTEMGIAGEFGDADVFGPLALDNALLRSAAEAKGIRHPVAGYAECMVAPTVEAGNILGKAVKYLGGSQCAHVVVGAKIPVLIPSRVESADDKVNAIALGVLYGSH